MVDRALDPSSQIGTLQACLYHAAVLSKSVNQARTQRALGQTYSEPVNVADYLVRRCASRTFRPGFRPAHKLQPTYQRVEEGSLCGI
jgi:hypothetical protein